MYVLVAIAMVVLILMQRGAGAQAGSGFGGGASSTVFGSRGASNFLTKSTKWLGVLFFAISMGMAMYASKSSVGALDAKPDLGVMGQAAPAPAKPAPAVPTAPVQPAQAVPACRRSRWPHRSTPSPRQRRHSRSPRRSRRQRLPPRLRRAVDRLYNAVRGSSRNRFAQVAELVDALP